MSRDHQHRLRVRLFYSYSHKDERYRAEVQKTLALLRGEGSIDDWSDHSILPGQTIPKKILDRMNKSDIFVFLLSRDFLASSACLDEWSYAEKLAAKRPNIVRVPIILRRCPWKDLPGARELKALPADGAPVKTFRDSELAWQEVYDGLCLVLDDIRNDFRVRPEFSRQLSRTQFISQSHVSLDDIFVFPRLTSPSSKGAVLDDIVVRDAAHLLESKRVIVVGDSLSGKTALCRHLFLSLRKRAEPVLYFDLDDARARPPALECLF